MSKERAWVRFSIVFVAATLGWSAAAYGTRASAGFGGEWVLRGEGVLRYAFVIDVYRARLYTPTHVQAERVLSDDVAKRLELTYFTDIEREILVEAANTVLARQLPTRLLEALAPELEALHAAYRDVEPGDQYTLVYSPGDGGRLMLNDEEVFRIEDNRVAQAYFGIWLGEEPISRSLRRKLLG